MKICFIMYPWEEVKPKLDTTLRLIHESVKRNFYVAMTTPDDLSIINSITVAKCRIFEEEERVSSSMTTFYKNAKLKTKNLPLSGFDVIFLRVNPPMDPLVLNFLDSVKEDVIMLNEVKGLREANNKIYTASYYDPDNELIPVTHVSKDVSMLRKIIDDSKSDKLILKPLDGYGGKGVIIIEKSASRNIKSLLDFYINHSGPDKKSKYVILQEYIPEAEEGDVRVWMLHGEPIGAIRRVPASGEIRSNISAGGNAVKYKLTKSDIRLCRFVGEKLVRDGIYFAGLDLIGGKLIEVNVMSPGGFDLYYELTKIKLQERVVDYLEQRVKEQKRILKRKSDLDSMMQRD